MAKIGLRNFKYSVLDANDVVTAPETLGKAVTCKVTPELNAGELYADDSLAESDYSFKKGTISLEVDEDADETFAELLGHTVTSGEVVRNANDVAPFVAVGRILTKLVNGVKQYKVEYLSKCKFKEPNADEATKGESIEFKTNAIEGTVMTLENGEWSKAKTFTTYDDASAYLTGLLTAPTPPTPSI